MGGETKPRRVFYVRREFLVDAEGRPCLTPPELGIALSDAVSKRDKEAVAGCCWAALNFVHNGKVPKNWLGPWKKTGSMLLAI